MQLAAAGGVRFCGKIAFAVYSKTFRKLGGGKNVDRIRSERPHIRGRSAYLSTWVSAKYL